MTELPEGVLPGSPAAQALEELGKEGFEAKTETQEFNEDGTPKETPSTDADNKEAEDKAKAEADQKATEDANLAKGLNADGTKKEESVKRDIGLVPAFKLKVAESQKEKVEKDLADAKAEIERLSKKPEDLNVEDEKVLDEALKTLSEKHSVDPEFLKDLKGLMKNSNTLPKEIKDKLALLDNVVAEKTQKDEQAKIQAQETFYNSEFEKDVLPLLKVENPKISAEAIEKIKEDLKVMAFSEGYNFLPLKKIFYAEKESLKLPVTVEPKKTTEDKKSGAERVIETVDFENMTEAKFNSLSDEDASKYLDWQKNNNKSPWKK